MPNGYGGQRGGYGQRGGGYRSSYQYQPARPAIQYESFYDPIPVESLISSSQRSAQEYSAAYTGALAAQDALAQELVGMQDIASKNQLINESIANMNTTVKDKYGGDWGRASKEIAGLVTQARGDPYWNAAKEAESRRKEMREMKIKHGPNLFVFNDPTKIGVMDDQGKLRGYEAFAPDVAVKGDWIKTARELLGGLTADEYKRFGFGEGEFEGFIRGEKVEAITRQKIERMANDPAIQQALLGRHQEIRRGIEELSPEQQRQHGLFGKTPEQVAYETLLGAGASAEYRAVDQSIQQDPFAVIDYKAAQTAAGAGYSPSATRQSFQTTSSTAMDEHMKRITPAPAAKSYPGGGGPLAVIPDVGAQQPTEADLEAGRVAWEKKLDAYHVELGEEYKQLKDLPRDEAFAAYENWINVQSEQSTLAWNMKLDDSAANIKSNLVSNLPSANFEVKGVTATGDVVGRNNIADKTGYNKWEDFVASFTAGDIETVPKVDFLNNSLSLTIAANPNRPKRSEPVTLHFQTDQQTRNMIETGHTITSQMYDGQSYDGTKEKPLLDRDGRPTGIGLAVKGEADILTGNNDKVVVMTDYNLPEDDPNRTRVVRLEDVQAKIAQTIDVRYNNFQGKLGNPGKLK